MREYTNTIYSEEAKKYVGISFKPKHIEKLLAEFKLEDKTIKLLAKAHSKIGVLQGIGMYSENFENTLKFLRYDEVISMGNLERKPVLLSEIILEKQNNHTSHILNACDVINSIHLEKLSSNEISEICKKIFQNYELRKREYYYYDKRFDVSNPYLVQFLMEDLLEFINDYECDILIKIAMFYYQFNTIMPFENGNDMLALVICHLKFKEESDFELPILFVAREIFKQEKQRDVFFLNLQRLSKTEEYLDFFLKCIIENTAKNIKRVQEIELLRKSTINQLEKQLGNSKYVKESVNFIENNPIFTIKELADDLSVSFNTANKIVDRMIDTNIINEISGKDRYKVFDYNGFLDIINEKSRV